MSLRQDLPFLNALAVFEVAARLGGFTAAARELGIAQSAVSRHVANLERYFGVELFTRSGRHLTVTPNGQKLADAVGIGLGHIRNVLNDLRARSDAAITIACSYDVAYLWLMPRFGALRAEMADRDMRLITAADHRAYDDPLVDVSIRFGHATDWPDTIAVRLFDEEVFPVCSPAFLARHPELRGGDPRVIARLPLLHLEHKETLRGVALAAMVRPRRRAGAAGAERPDLPQLCRQPVRGDVRRRHRARLEPPARRFHGARPSGARLAAGGGDGLGTLRRASRPGRFARRSRCPLARRVGPAFDGAGAGDPAGGRALTAFHLKKS